MQGLFNLQQSQNQNLHGYYIFWYQILCLYIYRGTKNINNINTLHQYPKPQSTMSNMSQQHQYVNLPGQHSVPNCQFELGRKIPVPQVEAKFPRLRLLYGCHGNMVLDNAGVTGILSVQHPSRFCLKRGKHNFVCQNRE